jgi:hypothetical protein
MKTITLMLTILLLTSCSSNSTGDYYTEEDGKEIEIGNPYSQGSGHYAGYEWAESNGGDCSRNSDSFNEGCEEYYRQINQ